MELAERTRGTTVVLDIRGPMDRESGGAKPLAAAMNRLVASGCTLVLLNVEELTAIDSVALGAIAQAHTTAARAGVPLKLANPTPRMRELLHITKLDRFIQIADEKELRT